MAARAGDTPLAIQVFEQALADGFWCDPQMLREDEDLASLQGLPEFERLAAICQQHYEAAQALARPELALVQPEGQDGSFPLLLALHGNSRNIANSIDFWRPAIAQGWLLAVPQSSQTVWPDAFVWNDRDRAVSEIQQHDAALAAQYPIDRSRVVVGGFSMGGGLAIWLPVSGAIEARGFVAVAPYLPDAQSLAPLLDAQPSLRGYIIVGENDAACLKSLARGRRPDGHARPGLRARGPRRTGPRVPARLRADPAQCAALCAGRGVTAMQPATIELQTPRGQVTIRPTREADAEAYRELRLEALRMHPTAFGADYAEDLARPIEQWQQNVRDGAGGQQGILYVAEADGALIGMTGVYRRDRAKMRHHATIWGVYVRPAWRGARIADALIAACLGWSRSATAAAGEAERGDQQRLSDLVVMSGTASVSMAWSRKPSTTKTYIMTSC